MQMSYAQTPRRRVNFINLGNVFRFVAPRVRDAAVKTATQLDHLGIRYALAGGLAVGAHGYVRATINIDYLSSVSLGPQLEEVLDHPPTSEGLAVVPIQVLVYMKLVAKRRKDQVDIIELVKAGVDLKRVRHYLDQYARDLLPLFDELVDEALAE